MVLGNTPRRETNFAIEVNKSFAFGVQFNTVDGKPVDLTGCDVRLVAVDSYASGMEVGSGGGGSLNPTSGFSQFNIQAPNVALAPGTYPYDVTIVFPNGYSVPVLKGYFELGPNADVESMDLYTDIIVGADLTVTLDIHKRFVVDVKVAK